MNKIPFADLGGMEEDKRIDTIGHAVRQTKGVVGFITDEEPGKPERYIAKLKAKFPEIVVISQSKGPTKKSVLIKVGLEPTRN
jgi:hypothetical protein